MTTPPNQTGADSRWYRAALSLPGARVLVCLMALAITAQAETDPVIAIGSDITTPSGLATLPIILTGEGDELAILGSIVFDPTVFSNPQFALGNGAPASAILTENLTDAESGRIGFLVGSDFGDTFAAGSHVILELQLTVSSEAARTVHAVTFGDTPARRGVANELAQALTATWENGSVTVIDRDDIFEIVTEDSDDDGMDDFAERFFFDDLSRDGTGDFDEDGLNDADELTHRSFPNKKDSDDDGLEDGPEVSEHGTNPANADTDGDNLTDGVEVNELETNPNLADTDGDGLNDDVEVNAGTNPNERDSDGDGESDFLEVTMNPDDFVAYWTFDTQDAIDLQNGYVGKVDGEISSAGFDGSAGALRGRASIDDKSFHDVLTGAFAEKDALTVTWWQNIEEGDRTSSWWMTSQNSDRLGQVHAPFFGNVLYFDTVGCCSGETQRISGPGPAGAFAGGGWHHFAAVKNGVHKSIWVDGELVVEGVNTSMLNEGGAVESFFINGDLLADNQLTGWIDEFIVVTAALTESQIKLLANSGAGSGFVLGDTTDSDGDGMFDRYEKRNGLDPNVDDAAGDLDGDNLTNLTEFHLRTNANNKDTDGDSLEDNVETGTGIWVSVEDTGTKVKVADSDGDGLNDGVEANGGSDPNNADSDGDGYSDFVEVTLLKTDPMDQADELDLELESIATGNGDGDGLNIATKPGVTYALNVSDNGVDWLEADRFTATGTEMTLELTEQALASLSDARRFYTVAVSPDATSFTNLQLQGFYNSNGGRDAFPPHHVKALEALLFAQDELEAGEVDAARSRVDAIFAEMPLSDPIWFADRYWRGLNLGGGSVGYYGLRMLKQILDLNNPSGAGTLRMTVVVATRATVNRRKLKEDGSGFGEMETVDLEINPRILANNAHVLHTSTKLFRRWVQAITGGLEVELVVHVMDGSATVNADRLGDDPNAQDSDGDGMFDSYEQRNGLNPNVNDAQEDRNNDGQTNIDEFNRWADTVTVYPEYNAMVDSVPADIANETDFWWVLTPSGIIGDGSGYPGRVLSGGQTYHSGPPQRPLILSDDLWFTEKMVGLGTGSYTEIELRAYMPVWFQHEFMHYVYSSYPEFQLEATSHQWFDRSTWPDDFVGEWEPDYFIESITKRLLTAQPSLAETFQAPTFVDVSTIDLQKLVGNYERRPILNGWHEVSITLESNELRWSNQAGRQFTGEVRDMDLWILENADRETRVRVVVDDSGNVTELLVGDPAESYYRID